MHAFPDDNQGKKTKKCEKYKIVAKMDISV
jgi:hypothetical protein